MKRRAADWLDRLALVALAMILAWGWGQTQAETGRAPLNAASGAHRVDDPMRPTAGARETSAPIERPIQSPIDCAMERAIERPAEHPKKSPPKGPTMGA